LSVLTAADGFFSSIIISLSLSSLRKRRYGENVVLPPGRRRLKKVGRESTREIYNTILYIIRVRRARETSVQVQSPKSLWHRLSSSTVTAAAAARTETKRIEPLRCEITRDIVTMYYYYYLLLLLIVLLYY